MICRTIENHLFLCEWLEINNWTWNIHGFFEPRDCGQPKSVALIWCRISWPILHILLKSLSDICFLPSSYINKKPWRKSVLFIIAIHQLHDDVIKWKHFRVTGHLCGKFTGDPTQRPLARSFDVFFDLRPNKRLSKQSRGWWFETASRSLWRHCNGDKI